MPVELQPQRLSELPQSGQVDLVVQVLKVQSASMVFVWDGTVRANLLTVYVLPPTSGCFSDANSSERHLPPYSVLRVTGSGFDLLAPGQWVHFAGLQLATDEGRLSGSLGLQGCLSVLPLEDPTVQLRCR